MNLVEQAKIKDPKLRSCIIALLQETDDRNSKIKALIAKYNVSRRVTGKGSKDFDYFIAELKIILSG